MFRYGICGDWFEISKLHYIYSVFLMVFIHTHTHERKHTQAHDQKREVGQDHTTTVQTF